MPNKIPEPNRKEVIERADGRCEVCGAEGAEIHHVIPRRKRIHRVETLILLCGPVTFKDTCHYKAHNADLKDELRQDLQEHYRQQGYKEDEIRELMGGRLYVNNRD